MKTFGFYSGYKEATETTGKLTELDLPCDFVTLSVWSISDDKNDLPIPEYAPPGSIPGGGVSYADKPTLIYYGFGAQAIHELAAGETTRLIPTRNARDIFVRALKTKTTRVYFSCFKSE